MLQVIDQCALQHDLDLFEDGDGTEIGERGLMLRYGDSFLAGKLY